MKKCSKCGKVLTLDNFYSNGSSYGDGKRAECKKCNLLISYSWIKRNREKVKIYQKKSKKKRRKKILKWQKEYNKLPKTKKRKCAENKITHLISVGKIKRGNCSVCGEKNAEAHHPNYNEPFKILWLCRRHHVEWHKKNQVKY